jgi:superoxide dismutase, Fe-Mn family
MAYELPELPYPYDALEPYIDERTMSLHHEKHHGTYVANLNAALEKHPEADPGNVDVLITELGSVPEDIRTAVRNNGGGHTNHSMFWQSLAPSSGVGGVEDLGKDLAEAITWGFGSLESLKERFVAVAAPGVAAHGGQDARAGAGPVGARLLPQVPAPPLGVHQRFLERGELARGG